MSIVHFRKQVSIRRFAAVLLVALMLINQLPAFLVTSALADDSDSFIEHEFSGEGSLTDPWILENEQDFKNLAENVANIEYYSTGKYFEVRPAVNPGDEGIRALYFSDNANDRVLIGSLEDEPAYWFYGNLNMNNTTLYTSYPILGTVSDGASVSFGYLVLSDNGDHPEIYDSAWGSLAHRVVSSGGEQSGEILVRNMEVAVDIDLADTSRYHSSALGGLIGTVANDSSEALVLEIDTVELAAKSNRNFSIRSSHGAMGGLIGTLDNGDLFANDASHIGVRLNNVTVDGVVENQYADGLTGGFIGRTNQGCVVELNGETEVPDGGLVSGGITALLIAQANQALVYTKDSFSLLLNGTQRQLGDDLDKDLLRGAAVLAKLDPSIRVLGTGQESDPYVLATPNHLLLLSAALNTLNGSALACFNYPDTVDAESLPNANHGKPLQFAELASADDRLTARQYLQQAHYQVAQDIDVQNTGFFGLGYYLDATRYVSFSGVFGGNNEINPPIINFGMRSTQGVLGFFPVLDGATISNLVLDGEITSDGEVLGSLAAYGVLPGQTVNPGFTVRNVESRVDITAS
ncbi:MAG: hypothetical protein EOM70_12200, partial [Clostridia bacterium]|nr:hypothetical protein [Clostridia bacterium]